MLVGTNKGLLRVETDQIEVNRYQPPIQITEVLTSGSKVPILFDTELGQTFALDRNTNNVKIHFAALDFTEPLNNLYRYKLISFEKDWIYAGNATSVQYTNLDPGSYQFVVEGTNSDGIWSATGAKISFDVKVPTSDIILYLLALSLIILAGFVYFLRKGKIRELYQRANYDALTGLANRYQFNRALNRLITHGGREFSVAFLDLDHFKEINDSLGHDCGDELIIQVGKRLQSCLRDRDLLARLGGDEFSIIINDYPDEHVLAEIVERMRSAVSAVYNIHNHKLTGSASIGLATYPKDGSNGQTLLKNADTAMYAAKREGRNRAFFYTDELSQLMFEKFTIRNALHDALSNKELQVFYQPKCNCFSGDVIGFEALLRWIHPQHGFIAPDKFIPEAEANDAIIEIGEWVLREACTQASIWHRQGLLTTNVSVNLSPVQILQPDLCEKLQAILDETGLPPNKLELEVTETVLIEHIEKVSDTLRKIHAMEVRIALDDFGTGYSSLSYLTQFPFQTLKIDRSFVWNLEKDQTSLLVLKNIFNLASDLQMTVVAEGIESERQLDIIKHCQCTVVQGYYYSPAVPFDRAIEMLTAGILVSTS